MESDFLGSTVSEELVPGGSRLAVIQGNLLQVRPGGVGGGAGVRLAAALAGFCLETARSCLPGLRLLTTLSARASLLPTCSTSTWWRTGT